MARLGRMERMEVIVKAEALEERVDGWMDGGWMDGWMDEV